MIIKNYKKFIINEALAIRKKDTIDPIIELYLKDKEINKDVLEIINKDSADRILKEPDLDKNSAYKKSFQSYIIKILKTLSLRIKKDGQILIDTSLELFNKLAPIFIDLNMKKRTFSLEELTSLYSVLEGLQFDKKYIDVLNILIGYYNLDNKYINSEQIISTFVIFKNLFVSGNELNININNKSFPLVNYIGKNEPVWWPYNNSPLEKPLEEWGLINYIGNINNFEGDARSMAEIISDRVRDIKSMYSIVYFTDNIIPEKFVVSNKESSDYGKTIDLQQSIYTENNLSIKQKIQFLSPLVQNANKNIRDIIYRKIRTYRKTTDIINFIEASLNSTIPTDISPIITIIEEINRKLGKSNGIEILYENNDYTVLIVEVKTFEANKMLNGPKPKGELTLSKHCIAEEAYNWNSYVGSEGPNGRNREYTLQFYIYDLNQIGSNDWVIGISMNKNKVSACHTYSDGPFMDLLDNHLKQENIPFYEILNKIDPNDNGTKYEGMTLLEKKLFIKQKQIEINLKIKTGNLTISEIEEALEEGANINAYDGILIKNSINDFEKMKYLISKGASVQYLFDSLDNIIKNNNFELLKFLIKNNLNVSKYVISEELVKRYYVFKVILDTWGDVKLTNDNISITVFNTITDIRVISLIQSKGFNIKEAIGVDLDFNARDSDFITNNQDNYPIIKFLFDKNILKYNPNNYFNIFPFNIDVYNLFILNGYPINYQDSTVLYNFAKIYKKGSFKDKKFNDIKIELDNILDLYLSENLIYRKDCHKCNGYGIVGIDMCSNCGGKGLTNQLGNYKTYIEKKGDISSGSCFVDLFTDEYFCDKFINVLIKLHNNNVDVSELFETGLSTLVEPKLSEIKSKIKSIGLI
jgi:hypothetical protein